MLPQIGPVTSKLDQLVVLTDGDGHVLKNRPYRVWTKDGQIIAGTTDVNGATKILLAESEQITQMQILKRLE